MYELFWAGEPHTAGTGFWVETLEPFELAGESVLHQGYYSIRQGIDHYLLNDYSEAKREVDNLNSQLEAYRSKQLSLNIKGVKQ
jgi:hypothetical protein